MHDIGFTGEPEDKQLRQAMGGKQWNTHLVNLQNARSPSITLARHSINIGSESGGAIPVLIPAQIKNLLREVDTKGKNLFE